MFTKRKLTAWWAFFFNDPINYLSSTMKILFFLTLFLFLSGQADAQHFRLELLKVYNLSDSASLKNDPYFGGLSGIEYVPKRGKWYLVTDGADSTRQSYLFEFDSLFNAQTYKRWKLDSVYSAESIRASRTDSSFFLSTELGSGSTHGQFLRLMQDSTVTQLGTYQGFRDNKGFEAMAVDSNQVLWSVSEWPQTCRDRYCQVTGYSLISGDTLVRALYPIDTVSCGFPDNGVSEILLARDRQLLFLERCWTGERDQSNYAINLFTAYIPKLLPGQENTTNILEKNPVSVNWGGVHLDNIEGMSWGPIMNGFRTLVLVSDNNFNKFDQKKAPEHWQQSQLIFLKLIPD